jgi:hypothetical protein
MLVITVQAVWIRHGMETSWLDFTVDAKIAAGLGGHPRLLAVLVWPGEPVPFNVTNVVALATALAVLLASAPRRLRLALAFAAFLVAGATAVGVIGAQMHHFSDTIGGAAVGIGTVLLTALTLDLLSASRADSPGLKVRRKGLKG